MWERRGGGAPGGEKGAKEVMRSVCNRYVRSATYPRSNGHFVACLTAQSVLQPWNSLTTSGICESIHCVICLCHVPRGIIMVDGLRRSRTETNVSQESVCPSFVFPLLSWQDLCMYSAL